MATVCREIEGALIFRHPVDGGKKSDALGVAIAGGGKKRVGGGEALQEASGRNGLQEKREAVDVSMASSLAHGIVHGFHVREACRKKNFDACGAAIFTGLSKGKTVEGLRVGAFGQNMGERDRIAILGTIDKKLVKIRRQRAGKSAGVWGGWRLH